MGRGFRIIGKEEWDTGILNICLRDNVSIQRNNNQDNDRLTVQQRWTRCIRGSIKRWEGRTVRRCRSKGEGHTPGNVDNTPPKSQDSTGDRVRHHMAKQPRRRRRLRGCELGGWTRLSMSVHGCLERWAGPIGGGKPRIRVTQEMKVDGRRLEPRRY